MRRILLGLMIFAPILAFGRAPQKNLLFIGGGGEPRGNQTIFDSSAEQAGRFFSANGWKARVLFNGGHSQTEQAIKKGFGFSGQTFTKANFAAELERIRLAIKNGDFQKGDEFLLLVDTHGANQGEGELSHSIVTNDGIVSLDQMKSIRELLEKAGVKVGIIDASCYSGNSLHLASAKTCAISVTRAGSVGNVGTISNILAKMNAGKSLEEVFLQMRTMDTNLAFPEISTSAGKMASSEITALQDIGPTLNRFQHEPEFTTTADSLEGKCKIKGISAETEQFFAQMQTIAKLIPSLRPELNDLSTAFFEYQQQVQRARALNADLQKFEDERVEMSIHFKDSNTTTYYPLREFIGISPKQAGENFANLSKTMEKLTDAQTRDLASRFTKLVEAKQNEMSRSPKYKVVMQEEAEYTSLVRRIFQKSGIFIAKERKLYDALYRAESL